ncbi:sensor histidine kinase [Actinomadura algeriensis]|uniref:histidine kinase n=1 Tax=Actinomadura algeriensis TaxID=1679523 RepID=A0ABR9K0H6_9ACTN|nr:histidine kinase [Actinomadura algeriensis]MBE1536327.1 signal transduction histidine kinase [Actinomadura algeriensis]
MTTPPASPTGAPADDSAARPGGRARPLVRRLRDRTAGRRARPGTGSEVDGEAGGGAGGGAGRQRRVPRGDAALAAGALLITLVLSAAAARPGDQDLWPGGAALIAAATLVLAARRRHPAIVLAVAISIPQVYYPLGYPDGPVMFMSYIALFSAAVECRLIVSLSGVIAANAGFIVASVLWGDTVSDPDAPLDAQGLAALTLGLLVTVAAGQYVRGRRAQAEAAERRAAAAERDREQEARRRETQERLRIARELHDVLAHQISLINVQAGAALHRRDDPERAYAALEAIKAASKETLRELRGVLGVLRQVDEAGDDPGGTGGAAGGSPVAPVPSLARVGELLEQTAAAGVAVRRAGDLAAAGAGPAGEGGLAALPAPVGLAGYRIVQEALTNAVRHSGAGEVTVEIRRTAAAVIVEVVDDGTGAAGSVPAGGGPGGGNGLRGMRERAAAVGGELTAGPAPGGGFRVWARLPLDPPPDPSRRRAAGPRGRT